MNNLEYFYTICVTCGILGGAISGAILSIYTYIVNRNIKKYDKPVRHIQIVRDATKTTIKEL